MLAKFLAVEEAISIAPHSTAEVKLQDADLSNVGFIFPTTETAARWLILANAGLLLWPAKAFVYNSKDVTQNLSRGDCIAMNVALEGEGLKAGAIETPVENDSSEAESETDESPENAEEAPAEDEMVTDPNEVEGSEPDAESEESTEENADADEVASTETDESPEEKEEEETPKKSSRSKK